MFHEGGGLRQKLPSVSNRIGIMFETFFCYCYYSSTETAKCLMENVEHQQQNFSNSHKAHPPTATENC